MEEIAMIAPYQDLFELAIAINRALPQQIAIERGLLSGAVIVARRLQEDGVKVFISRGGTALAIRQSPEITVPVVEIPVTGFDILRAVHAARSVDRRVAVIGFENMVMGAKSIESIIGVEIEEFLLHHEHEAESRLLEAQAHGIKVVAGGVITIQLAEELGMAAFLINTGPEGIRQAVEEARRVLGVRKQEATRAELFQLILDNAGDGIVATDEAGRITVFNQTAEKLTGLSAIATAGRPVTTVLPDLGLQKVLRTGQAEQADVHSLGGKQVSINRLPIMVQGSCAGSVATFQEVDKLQSLERKIRRQLHARGHVARHSLADIAGESPAIMRCLAQAKRFAEVNSTVLIVGETGTGKELFAQGVHSASQRHDGPFVAVNCAALPENLLESELFGYVGGAFTGARREGKVGLFELAHGGTIFLDEIAGMSPRLQARLLRVLQEHEVMRLGDDRVLPVDVRVIAATNKDLRRMVAEGQFLADLYHRLDVLKLSIPPLRERAEDIEVLTMHLSEVVRRRVGGQVRQFTPEAIRTLESHSWPGNVRELRNIIERLVVLTPEGQAINVSAVAEVLEEHVGSDFSRTGNVIGAQETGVAKETAGGSGIAGPVSSRKSLRESLSRAEKEIILKTLAAAGGNKAEAARMLGLNRSTLWRKLNDQ